MNGFEPLVDLAIAIGLGLLVGFQRESQARNVGLRTFALVTMSGALAGLLVPAAGGWIVALGLLAVGLLAAVDHYADSRQGHTGLTTEVAMVAMYLIGVYLTAGDRRIAVVMGGTVAVLLQAKAPFRRVMERLGSDDVRAIMQLALLSLVILPILPNRDFGPWRVLNLFEIWLLVVLIVGINLAGYIAWRFTRGDTGTLLTGLLGGVISSTATTVTYARRTRGREAAAPVAAVVLMIATAVVLVRVLIEVAVVAPAIFPSVAVPIAIVLVMAALLSLAVWWRTRREAADMPDQESPTMLRAALLFGALYAVVLLGAAWVKEGAGEAGLYAVAAVAGLTDVDAITLSTARMAAVGEVEATQTWRVILIAFLSNLVFKLGIVAVAGSRRLLATVATLFALLGAGAALVIGLYR
ncbi:MAG TPA: MgtC/SapB family protein [Thermoanaerobaculia bacterium]|nr:MgtC/SapB family protein [Thermoanaerobaculia bacterium]